MTCTGDSGSPNWNYDGLLNQPILLAINTAVARYNKHGVCGIQPAEYPDKALNIAENQDIIDFITGYLRKWQVGGVDGYVYDLIAHWSNPETPLEEMDTEELTDTEVMDTE